MLLYELGGSASPIPIRASILANARKTPGRIAPETRRVYGIDDFRDAGNKFIAIKRPAPRVEEQVSLSERSMRASVLGIMIMQRHRKKRACTPCVRREGQAARANPRGGNLKGPALLVRRGRPLSYSKPRTFMRGLHYLHYALHRGRRANITKVQGFDRTRERLTDARQWPTTWNSLTAA